MASKSQLLEHKGGTSKFKNFTFISCWKNSIEWIRNWYFLCSLKDVIIVIKSGKNPESHIGKEIDNMRFYAHELDIGLGFWHMWTGPTCPNNNILSF